ncbi:MAG: ERV1/ALR-related protein [Colwellia sp.]|nr:ERV1/ALR-related protein [Colwellia sp.]
MTSNNSINLVGGAVYPQFNLRPGRVPGIQGDGMARSYAYYGPTAKKQSYVSSNPQFQPLSLFQGFPNSFDPTVDQSNGNDPYTLRENFKAPKSVTFKDSNPGMCAIGDVNCGVSNSTGTGEINLPYPVKRGKTLFNTIPRTKENFAVGSQSVKYLTGDDPLLPGDDDEIKTECSKSISNIITKYNDRLTNPAVFGPPSWFTYHNGAAHVSEYPDSDEQEYLKGYIRGIAVMAPCNVCKIDAAKFVKGNEFRLDDVVSSRINLFNFYVDFHNYVNIKNGKPTMSHEDAAILYRIDTQCSI